MVSSLRDRVLLGFLVLCIVCPGGRAMDVKGFFQDVHVKAMNQVEAISQKCELPQFTAPSAVQDCMERLDRNLDRIVEGVEAKVQKFHQQVSGINPTEMISAVNRAPETCLHKIRTVFAEGWNQLSSPNPSSNGNGATPAFLSRRMTDRSVLREDAIEELNQKTLQNVLGILQEENGWEHMVTAENVTVYRKNLDLTEMHEVFIDGDAIEEKMLQPASSSRFACIKAIGVIDAPIDKVYELFLDNSRVQEYNEHCRYVSDIDFISEDTKVTWAASGRFGPFKARDFCTLVHYRRLADGSLVVINRAAQHAKAPRSDKYVRSQILIAGNIMRPHTADPRKTELVTLTHVNPGGCVDSKAGAFILNSLSANSPVQFIKRVEQAAQKSLEKSKSSRDLGEGVMTSLQWAFGKMSPVV